MHKFVPNFGQYISIMDNKIYGNIKSKKKNQRERNLNQHKTKYANALHEKQRVSAKFSIFVIIIFCTLKYKHKIDNINALAR